jgi:uncharacterized cupredoxin-like copper-binding protein
MSSKNKYLILGISFVIIVGALFSFLLFYYPRLKEKALVGREISFSEATESSSEPIEITMEISSGKIEPKSFKVRPNQKVKLTIIALDDGPHSFTFQEQELAVLWAYFTIAGRTEFLEFTAPTKKGEYHFYCTQEGHREAGEEGVMIVE